MKFFHENKDHPHLHPASYFSSHGLCCARRFCGVISSLDMNTCAVNGCNKESRCRGWCYMHYARWYRHGDALKTQINMEPVTWEYLLSCSVVDDKTGCIEWKKGKSQGYGSIRINDVAERTHRISYELNYGKIENKLQVCHHCDNRLCINPEHLFLGTQKDNMADASNKGRISRGENHYLTKLTENNVLAIREMNGTNKQLAKIFGVSVGSIYGIRRKDTWRWLT